MISYALNKMCNFLKLDDLGTIHTHLECKIRHSLIISDSDIMNCGMLTE